MYTKMVNYTSRWPWIMVCCRHGALWCFPGSDRRNIPSAAGMPDPWGCIAGWWPITAFTGSIVVMALLVWLYHQEGARYWLSFVFRETLASIC